MHQPPYTAGAGAAPPPPRTATAYFDDIQITGAAAPAGPQGGAGETEGAAGAYHTPGGQAGGGTCAAQCRCPAADADIAQPLPPPTFTATTAQPVSVASGRGHEHEAAGEGEGAVCQISVGRAGLDITVQMPGEAQPASAHACVSLGTTVCMPGNTQHHPPACSTTLADIHSLASSVCAARRRGPQHRQRHRTQRAPGTGWQPPRLLLSALVSAPAAGPQSLRKPAPRSLSLECARTSS